MAASQNRLSHAPDAPISGPRRVGADPLPAGAGNSWLRLIADPVRLEIIQALARSKEASAADIARSGPTSEPTLRRHLEALVSLGLVQQRYRESDGTIGRPPTLFSLSPEVRASVRAILKLGF